MTIGLAAGRFPVSEIAPSIAGQVAGAILGALVLYVIASGTEGFDAATGFAANGYGAHSPDGYSLGSAFLAEVVLSMMFLFIIMGSTHFIIMGSTRGRAPVGFAPVAIGLGLTLMRLIGIPVTNTSVNPARSTGPALFAGGWAIGQLWLFWLAPIIGGALGGLLYSWLSPTPTEPVVGGIPSQGRNRAAPFSDGRACRMIAAARRVIWSDCRLPTADGGLRATGGLARPAATAPNVAAHAGRR